MRVSCNYVYLERKLHVLLTVGTGPGAWRVLNQRLQKEARGREGVFGKCLVWGTPGGMGQLGGNSLCMEVPSWALEAPEFIVYP